MRRERMYRAASVTFVIGGVRHEVPALADRFVTISEPALDPKPGDILVYKERGLTLDADEIRRATFTGNAHAPQAEVTREGVREWIWWNDVIRVEPTQHGWCGVPETSGAW